METANNFDVIIIGGGFSGSVLGLSLVKKNAKLKIAIIEKSTEFPQKVGESNSDVTALYLKSLRIDHILCNYPSKTGLRFLFNEKNSGKLEDIAEMTSPSLEGVNNGFHLDRKKFDQELLEEAEKSGIAVFRPANITELNIAEFDSSIKMKIQDEEYNISGKWIADASGRRRLLFEKMGWKNIDTVLNTSAIMTHYTGISEERKWDLPKNEYWESKAIGPRDFSTIHFMREHSWWWMIRLDDKTTSIGVVYDHSKLQIDDPQAYFDETIRVDLQMGKLTANATRSEIIVMADIAYLSEKLYEKGVALIGDSGAFVDPFLSPGLEFICQQAAALSELLEKDIRSEVFDEKSWIKYEKNFLKAIKSRMIAYNYGYDFMGSFDLGSAWIKMGNMAYFASTVFPLIKKPSRIKNPLAASKFQLKQIKYFHWRLMRIKKRRQRQKRASFGGPFAITYSGIYVPPRGAKFFFGPFKLFFKWWIHFQKLLLLELFYVLRKSK